MIARTWRATATPHGAELYEAHFRNSVLPELCALHGFHRAYLMRRPANDHVEIQVITIWESRDAIASFAGASLDSAVVEPQARAVLLHHDETVHHYELIEFPR